MLKRRMELEMTIGHSRPVPSQTAAGSSSSGSQRVSPARAAVLRMAAQPRTVKHVGLRGLARAEDYKHAYGASVRFSCFTAHQYSSVYESSRGLNMIMQETCLVEQTRSQFQTIN